MPSTRFDGDELAPRLARAAPCRAGRKASHGVDNLACCPLLASSTFRETAARSLSEHAHPVSDRLCGPAPRAVPWRRALPAAHARRVLSSTAHLPVGAAEAHVRSRRRHVLRPAPDGAGGCAHHPTCKVQAAFPIDAEALARVGASGATTATATTSGTRQPACSGFGEHGADRVPGRCGNGCGKPAEAQTNFRVFVGNLPFVASEQELEDLFSEYGCVTGVSIAEGEQLTLT